MDCVPVSGGQSWRILSALPYSDTSDGRDGDDDYGRSGCLADDTGGVSEWQWWILDGVG